MRSFLIENDDIVVDKMDIVMIEDIDEICQCVERALTTRIKEFFLNLEHGMDYEEMQSKAPNIERLKIDIIEAALQEERLNLIESIDIEIDRVNRKAKIKFIGRLEDGTLIEGEVNI